ncbi:MAG TPA: ABC transporter substrate-binding protein [Candidatus Limnocylindria bacterium]|jgi:NitT/TauT family transport system substrate-binding protein
MGSRDLVHTRAFVAVLLAIMVTAACTGPQAAPSASTGQVAGVLSGQARCDANKAAGKITFLTGFGFFPSVSVLDVIAAKQQGYFDAMCLDVDIQPSIPGESMVLVSSNTVQFAANSFGSIARGVAQGATVKAVVNYGNLPIHTLIVLADSPIQKLADFRGKTIGSTGGTTGGPNQAQLRTAGLTVEKDYKQIAIGFDSTLITRPGIDAIEGFRSNQPDLLERAGLKIRQFLPEDAGVVSTFGSIIVSNEFAAKHPAAVEDFIRADKMGWDWALAHSKEALDMSQKLTQGNFDRAHEEFRWKTESDLAVKSTPAGQPAGRVIRDNVAKEIAVYVQLGLIPIMDVNTLFDNQYFDAVHKDGKVVWPGPMGTR